ncbi:metal-dependent hydrolase [Actinomadura hibisca]|uniref:metal-dependent hydrolase n=1 Tax=Actinomadura hibisca TaxID=68565 RepID=UPI001FE0F112|nr:metal-dependent hydrolase [Actinomadura hibisca]
MGIGESTQVTFPAGDTAGRSRVLASVPLDGGYGVVVARTPFHPLDHTWPDQPGDIGVLRADGVEMRVVDCLTGAVPPGGGELLLGEEIPARRGDEGWAWLVVHEVERMVPEGNEAVLAVDEERRAGLSAGHTACHLMALALNAALAERWRKDVRADSLGRPDFDQLAIVSSRIVPGGSRDVYRIGKSLRKKGFVADGLEEELPEVAKAVNETLAGWVAADGPVQVVSPSPALTARRTWRCELPEGTGEIPCGGTHVQRTGALGPVAVRIEPEDGGFVVETYGAHSSIAPS